jgi:ferrochelatase
MRDDNIAHEQASAAGIGVLLVNLGTPDAPDAGSVRRYLAEFLSDRRVIELPPVLWQPLLHGIILRTRPRRTARLYGKIWTAAGSPFLLTSQRQTEAIRNRLTDLTCGPIHLELGMRYGNPSIRAALGRLAEKNMRRLLVLPLYPQYSATTTASTFDAIVNELRTWRRLPELRFINRYYDAPGYIEALTASIVRYRQKTGKDAKLLFSFHGLPMSYHKAGDPYYHECLETARLAAERAGLSASDWKVGFQSRFGPMEWLRPYTNDVLHDWAVGGVKNAAVVCPGFAADCLETLEEIAIRGREIFLGAGGTEYAYIPALNDEPAHIEFLASVILRHSEGWPEFIPR